MIFFNRSKLGETISACRERDPGPMGIQAERSLFLKDCSFSSAPVLSDRGTCSAFQILVEECSGPLYRFAAMLSETPTLAKELVRKAFSEVRPRLAPDGDLSRAKVWLFAQLYRDFLQKSDPRPSIDEKMLFQRSLSPVGRDEMEEMASAAISLLRELEEEFRVPLLLFYLEKFSIAEIAEILAWPETTVRSRIGLGKALLKQKMGLFGQADDCSAVSPFDPSPSHSR